MLLTAGVGVAFLVDRGIEHLRFPADAYYYKLESVPDVDAFGMLVAGVYGLCVTTVVIAIKSGSFWSSPGKTLALLFATMCVLNWGLDFVAASITSIRIQGEVVGPAAIDDRGYILGVWYRTFPVDVGYVACFPVLVWVIHKTKDQGLVWRLAWKGFLLFALAIVGYVHFGFTAYVPPALKSWYFEAAIGIPICLLFVAFVDSLARKRMIDWWTTMTVVPIFLVWCVGVVLKLA
jgi:hypothetical protein